MQRDRRTENYEGVRRRLVSVCRSSRRELLRQMLSMWYHNIESVSCVRPRMARRLSIATDVPFTHMRLQKLRNDL